MDAYKKADRALCVYGEIKRTRAEGGERTRDFMARMNAALAQLSEGELLTIKSLYVLQMTQAEAAEAIDCDQTTIARRKRRAVDRLALIMYTDQYLTEHGML